MVHGRNGIVPGLFSSNPRHPKPPAAMKVGTTDRVCRLPPFPIASRRLPAGRLEPDKASWGRSRRPGGKRFVPSERSPRPDRPGPAGGTGFPRLENWGGRKVPPPGRPGSGTNDSQRRGKVQVPPSHVFKHPARNIWACRRKRSSGPVVCICSARHLAPVGALKAQHARGSRPRFARVGAG